MNAVQNTTPTFPTPVHVLTQEHKFIDQEISRHEEAVRVLKSRRNSLASIARLPPELLSKIFSFTAALAAESRIPLSWIKVSHICRQWREIALSCPTLWATPSFESSHWAPEMLKRSKMAHLTIKADLTYMTPKMMESLKDALEHMERIAVMDFVASPSSMKKLLKALESQQAPALHTLSIVSNHGCHNYYSDPNERITLPSTVFQNFAPQLRRLELTKCSIPWSSGLYTNLSVLKVVNPGSIRPTMVELLDSLQKMPQLESLDLQDTLPAFPEETKFPPLPSCSINLPLLSKLCVADRMVECANLLNHLTFPPSTAIKLVCSSNAATDNDFSSLFSAFALNLMLTGSDTLPQSNLPRTLFVNHIDTTAVRFRLWRTTIESTYDELPRDPPAIEIELKWRMYGPKKYESVIRTVCKYFPLGQLRSLHVWQQESMSRDTWTNTFGRLPRLNEIHLQGLTGRQLIRAINPAPNGKELKYRSAKKGNARKGNLRPPPGTFAELRILSLEDVDFDDCDDSESVDECELLVDCLMMRCHYRVPIEELRLATCKNLYEDDVAMLQEVVSDVHWDKIVMNSSDYDEDEDVDEDEDDFDPFYDSDDGPMGYYSDEYLSYMF